MPDYLERLVRLSLSLPKDEILKSIDIDNEGRYWISNKGELISLVREQPRYKHFRDNGSGYYQTIINGKMYYLHRLLAFAFNQDKIKEQFKEVLEVHHLDRNRQNNNLDNLVIVSKAKHKAIHSIWNKLDKWRVIPWEESKPQTIKE